MSFNWQNNKRVCGMSTNTLTPFIALIRWGHFFTWKCAVGVHHNSVVSDSRWCCVCAFDTTFRCQYCKQQGDDLEMRGFRLFFMQT